MPPPVCGEKRHCHLAWGRKPPGQACAPHGTWVCPSPPSFCAFFSPRLAWGSLVPPSPPFAPTGECSNKDCPFLHVDAAADNGACPWYDRGFCRHGEALRNGTCAGVSGGCPCSPPLGVGTCTLLLALPPPKGWSRSWVNWGGWVGGWAGGAQQRFGRGAVSLLTGGSPVCGRTLVQVQTQAEGDVCQLPRRLLPRRTQMQIHAVRTAWDGGELSVWPAWDGSGTARGRSLPPRLWPLWYLDQG